MRNNQRGYSRIRVKRSFRKVKLKINKEKKRVAA